MIGFGGWLRKSTTQKKTRNRYLTELAPAIRYIEIRGYPIIAHICPGYVLSIALALNDWDIYRFVKNRKKSNVNIKIIKNSPLKSKLLEQTNENRKILIFFLLSITSNENFINSKYKKIWIHADEIRALQYNNNGKKAKQVVPINVIFDSKKYLQILLNIITEIVDIITWKK